MRVILSDIRYALRLMRRNAGFSATVVLAVALGVGVNTAIFTVVNGVLLTPLPYPEPDRIVRLYQSLPERNLTFFSVAPADFLDWKARTRSFDVMGAFTSQRSVGLTSTGEPTQVLTARASADLFRVLGVSPARGRLFADDEVDASTAVVSHPFWTTRLGGRADVLGASIALDGQTFSIVGVMPDGFSIPGSPAEIWTPLKFSASELARGNHFLRVLARLAPGVLSEAAQVEMEKTAGDLAVEYPATNNKWTARVRTLKDLLIGEQFERAMFVLSAAVGFVLLIACANVANLVLARGAGRAREMATRAALGASRTRLLRQLLTESMVLAAAGGAGGLLLALWGVDLLKSLNAGGIPRLDQVRGDWRVLAFTAAISVTTGLLFGVLPALQSSGTDVSLALKDARGAASLIRRRVRSVLVITEVALALVLLVGAGLMIKSFARLQDVPLGFDPDQVVTVPLSLPARYAQPAQIEAFFQQLSERLLAVRGVQAVGAISSVPMSGLNSAITFTRQGEQAQRDATVPPDTDYRVATAGYFGAMRIPLLRGRTFTADDRANGEQAVVISDRAAHLYWTGKDPVGERIKISAELFRIVGVVGDVRHFGPESELRPLIYFNHAQKLARTMTMVIRTDGRAAAAAPALRTTIWAIDKDLPIGAVQTMADIVSSVTAQRRFNMLLLSVFAALAVALAAVGVYGVMAYTVSLRTREIGVRMALGARAADVLALVLREGLSLALSGVVVGVLLALSLTRWLASMLFEVNPRDMLTFAGCAGFLTTAALLACYIPACRATSADPSVALRAE